MPQVIVINTRHSRLELNAWGTLQVSLSVNTNLHLRMAGLSSHRVVGTLAGTLAAFHNNTTEKERKQKYSNTIDELTKLL